MDAKQYIKYEEINLNGGNLVKEEIWVLFMNHDKKNNILGCC